MKLPNKPKKLEMMLMDPGTPMGSRVEIMKMLAHGEDEDSIPIFVSLLEAATANKAEDIYKEKLAEVNELLGSLKEGPLRCAVFQALP